MKKVILLSAAILAMSTACSDTEVIESGVAQQTNAIGFQSLVSKGSRAITTDNFDQFFVFGSYHTEKSTSQINIFNEIPVTKSGSTWGYSDPRYWIEKCVYTFSAYAVDDDALPSGALANYNDNKNLNITGFLADKDNQKDLAYAKINTYPATATGNNVQALEFKHILSRAKVKFTNNFPKGYNIKLTGIQISNIRNKGNFYGSVFDTANNPWVNPTVSGVTGVYQIPERAGTEPSIELTYANAIASGKTGETGFAYVIPFTYAQADVRIKFNLAVTYKADESSEEIPVFDKDIVASLKPDWKVNSQYCYNVILTGNAIGLEKIEFSGTVAEWGAVGDDINIPIDAGTVPQN